MEKRINQGYEIIQSLEVGCAEFVLGVNVKAPNQFVTWKCTDKTDYYWGHYMNSQLAAMRDLCERALEEVTFLEDRQERIAAAKAARSKDQEMER